VIEQPASPNASRVAWNEHSGGVDWHLELDRSPLLPAQLVTGRLSLRAGRDIEARGLLVGLRAIEHWRHRETHSDGLGHTSTTVVTSRDEVAHEPVQLRNALALRAGQTLRIEFELPVPPDGPATLAAEDAGLDWTVEAKLDIAGDLDSRIEGDVVVAQPTAQLRAGAVPLGELALYESADVAADGLTGSIELKPAPLVCGGPFTGRVSLRAPEGTRVRGVRGEFRVHVEATVSQGENQTIVLWSGVLGVGAADGVDDIGGEHSYEIAGTLPSVPTPSIELPHGRARASFHVILDRPWALDTDLSRDVAIATTAEI
jgi:hypothetical protein